MRYCETLEAHGSSDWRLPTVEEIEQVLDLPDLQIPDSTEALWSCNSWTGRFAWYLHLDAKSVDFGNSNEIKDRVALCVKGPGTGCGPLERPPWFYVFLRWSIGQRCPVWELAAGVPFEAITSDGSRIPLGSTDSDGVIRIDMSTVEDAIVLIACKDGACLAIPEDQIGTFYKAVRLLTANPVI